jgi:predicted Ser/Thr protein kinase
LVSPLVQQAIQQAKQENKRTARAGRAQSWVERLTSSHISSQTKGEFFFPEAKIASREEIAGAMSELSRADQSAINRSVARQASVVAKRAPEAAVAFSGIPPSPSKSPITMGWLKWLMAAGAGAWLISHFSGRDDPYNVIEGLPELGLASQQRKVLTDFGSGFDPLRRILGGAFEALTKAKTLPKMLARGEVVKELGRGGFGRAYLMKTQVRGQEFQYVKKVIDPKTSAHAAYIESLGGAQKILEREASAMTPFAGTKTVPTAYGIEEQALYMELMPGRSVYQSGMELPERAALELRKTAAHMAEKGIEHIDIAARNIMYDPVSGRVSLIDFGEHRAVTSQAESFKRMSEKVEKTTSWRREAQKREEQASVPAGPVARRAAKRRALEKLGSANTEAGKAFALADTQHMSEMFLASSQDLRKAQEQIWVNINGSRHHVRRQSNRSVVQLSRFDKKVK